MRPVFLGGYAKSGTTLTLSLLDSHPELLVFPEETQFFGSILPLLRSGGSKTKILDFVYTQTGVRDFEYGELTIPGIGNRDYSDIDFDRYCRVVERRWKSSCYAEAGLLEAIVLAYGEVTGQEQSKKFWVEKTPGNEYHIEQILRLFPEASVVYNIRDPRANLHSYRKKKKNFLNLNFTVEEFLIGWIGSLLAAKRAQLSISSGKDGVRRYENRFMTVVYDRLVQDPVAVMNTIIGRLGVAWDDQLVKPTRNGKPWHGNSMHGYEFRDVSIRPLSEWKGGLLDEEVQIIESAIGKKLFAHFGWDYSDSTMSNVRDGMSILHVLRRLLRHGSLGKGVKMFTNILRLHLKTPLM